MDFIDIIKINEKINTYSDKGYIYKSNKFYALTFDSYDFDTKLNRYDQIQFHLKDKDDSFIIESIAGIKLYENDFNDCYSFLKIREKEADSIFGKDNKNKFVDENEGVVTKRLGMFYNLTGDSNLYIACENWTIKSKIPDNFALVLNSSILQDWLNNEAYK